MPSHLCRIVHQAQPPFVVWLLKAVQRCEPAWRAGNYGESIVTCSSTTAQHEPHFVNPLPSKRITIQHPGRRVSSSSNCFTYSNLVLAMMANELLSAACSGRQPRAYAHQSLPAELPQHGLKVAAKPTNNGHLKAAELGYVISVVLYITTITRTSISGLLHGPCLLYRARFTLNSICQGRLPGHQRARATLRPPIHQLIIRGNCKCASCSLCSKYGALQPQR